MERSIGYQVNAWKHSRMSHINIGNSPGYHVSAWVEVLDIMCLHDVKIWMLWLGKGRSPGYHVATWETALDIVVPTWE